MCICIYTYVFMTYIVLKYRVHYYYIVLTVFYGKWDTRVKSIDDVHIQFLAADLS